MKLPDGWMQEELGDIVKSLDAGVSVNSEAVPPQNGEVGILKTSCVYTGAFRRNEAKRVLESELHRVKQPVRANSIIISRMNTKELVGASAYVPDDIPTLFLPDRLWQVSLQDDSRHLMQWLAYLLGSPRMRSMISTFATGTSGSMKNISKASLNSIPVVVPPLEEQRRIAVILSTWDRAIEQTEKLIAAKERRKKALMQLLLTGKKRFKEFEGQEWKEIQVGKLLKEVSRPVEWDEDATYDLISIKRRSGGLFRREPLKGSEIKTKELYVTMSGDFLISRMQVVHGALAMTTEEFDSTHISGSYSSFIARDCKKLHMAFFDLLSRMPEMYHKAYISSYGVHIEKMTFNLKLFLKETVLIPPTIEEQQRIASVLNTANKEINQLKVQADALRRQKQGLMQVLLTGKKRVKEPNIQTQLERTTT